MSQIIIGLAGPAGVGKSTVAEALRDILDTVGYDVEIRSFAGLLKKMARVIFPEIDEYPKEEPTDYLFGKSPRFVYQTLGTEWGRYLIDSNLWVKLALRDSESDVLIFDDVRFPNELEACTHPVKLLRGIQSIHEAGHASETSLDGHEILTVKNEDGEPYIAAGEIYRMVLHGGPLGRYEDARTYE